MDTDLEEEDEEVEVGGERDGLLPQLVDDLFIPQNDGWRREI